MRKVSTRKDGNAKALCHGEINVCLRKLWRKTLDAIVVKRQINYFYEAICPKLFGLFPKFIVVLLFILIRFIAMHQC